MKLLKLALNIALLLPVLLFSKTIRYTDGSSIVLIDNRYAQDPTFAQVVDFIKKDPTNTKLYKENEFVCVNFAAEVHNNAERQGIKTQLIGIDYQDQSIRHAIVAFNTTDKGLVYVDCTGSKTPTNYPELYDRIAYLKVGELYGSIPISMAKDTTYEYYEKMRYLFNVGKKWRDELSDMERELKAAQINSSDYRTKVQKYKLAIRIYNSLVNYTPVTMRTSTIKSFYREDK